MREHDRMSHIQKIQMFDAYRLLASIEKNLSCDFEQGLEILCRRDGCLVTKKQWVVIAIRASSVQFGLTVDYKRIAPPKRQEPLQPCTAAPVHTREQPQNARRLNP